MLSFRPQSITPDYSVRPAFRLLGSLLCGALAVLFLYDAAALLRHPDSVVGKCRPGRGQLSCELGNWLLAVLPASWRHPTLAIVAVVMCGAFVCCIWWLLRPLIGGSSSQKQAQP